MRVSVAALLAMASSVLAQTADFDAITAPTKDEVIPAGKTYTVGWTATAKYPGKVSISLIGGASNTTLQPLGDVATGVDNAAGKYEWAVASTLGKDLVYGLKITYESDTTIFQYSNPFHIKGSGSGSSSSASSSSGTASSYSTSTKSHSGHPSYTTSGTTLTSSYSTISLPTYTPSGNLSTTAGPTYVTSTSTTTGSTSATSGPATISNNLAATAGAGSFAMIGGLAIAVLAL